MFKSKQGDQKNTKMPALIKEEEYMKLAEKISEMKSDKAGKVVNDWIGEHGLDSSVAVIMRVVIQNVIEAIEFTEQEHSEYSSEVQAGAKGNRYDDEGEYDFDFDFENYNMNCGIEDALSIQLKSLKKMKGNLLKIEEALKEPSLDERSSPRSSSLS